jgi:hypothetical protein
MIDIPRFKQRGVDRNICIAARDGELNLNALQKK